GGAPPIDADLAGVGGSVDVAPPGVRIQVDGVGVKTRAMPRGLDANGEGKGRVALPAGGALANEGAVDGAIGGGGRRRAGGRAGGARGGSGGGDVDAAAGVRRVPGERLRAIAPEVAVRAEVGAHVEVRGDLPRIEAKATLTAGGGTLRASGEATLGEEARGNID